LEEEKEIMPMPFHCVECDKPIGTSMHGLCDSCKVKRDKKMNKYYNDEEE
jgi:NMD protein affecting ribosome stability and mRNA decay